MRLHGISFLIGNSGHSHGLPEFFHLSQREKTKVFLVKWSTHLDHGGLLHFGSLPLSSFFNFWLDFCSFWCKKSVKSICQLTASISSAYLIWYKRYGEFLGVEFQVSLFFLEWFDFFRQIQCPSHQREFIVPCICIDRLQDKDRLNFRARIRSNDSTEFVSPCPYAIIRRSLNLIDDPAGNIAEASLKSPVRFFRARNSRSKNREFTLNPLGKKYF